MKKDSRKLLNREAGGLEAANELAQLLHARKKGLIEGLEIAQDLIRDFWSSKTIAAAGRLGLNPEEWLIDTKAGEFKRRYPEEVEEEAGPGEADKSLAPVEEKAKDEVIPLPMPAEEELSPTRNGDAP